MLCELQNGRFLGNRWAVNFTIAPEAKLEKYDPPFMRIASGTIPPENNDDDDKPNGCGCLSIILCLLFWAVIVYFVWRWWFS